VLDIGVPERVDFVVFDSRLGGVSDEFELDLLGGVFAEPLFQKPSRRSSLSKARQQGVFSERLVLFVGGLLYCLLRYLD